MTKYVLNSGGLKGNPELARKFFNELVKDLGNSPKMLICFFAQKREDWEEKFLQDQIYIPAFMPEGVTVRLEMAMPETFVEQTIDSDVVYIHGGDDYLVQYWLKQFDLPLLFQNKTIGTNSAGSNAMAEHFWTCDWRRNMDGLGILPIKFLAHYKSDFGNNDPRGQIDWEKAYADLSDYGSSVFIHALKEGEYVVIEK